MGAQVETIPHHTLVRWTDANSSNSTLLGFFVVMVTVTAFLLSSDRFNHWFLIPISICGVLMGTDAVEWVRGRVGLYDPAGILGLFGLHFFFLAPLLQVKWDSWMAWVSPPPDWRDWLGYMGVLNVVGLLCYLVCRRAFKGSPIGISCKTFWYIDKTKFRLIVPSCLAIAAVLQIWVYVRMGGITGYMDARINNPSAFEGMGWIFMISESFPILAAFCVLLHPQQHNKISWSRASITLLALFMLQMVFGGLRGSRSGTVLLLFWVVGCIHLLVRPVPRKLVYVGCVFLMAFMYLYGFYKALGKDAAQAFSGSAERQQLSQKTGRTLKAVVIGDLARADVQAFVLYRLVRDGRDFTQATGRTYLGALSLFIPHSILPDPPQTKLKEGTEIQTGAGTYVPREFWSSRVYGLAGECMLNFGPIAVPFIYALFGLFIGWFRTSTARLSPGDARLLLVPLGVFSSVSALGGDFDNLTFALVKNGFMPCLVVILCAARDKRLSLHAA